MIIALNDGEFAVAQCRDFRQPDPAPGRGLDRIQRIVKELPLSCIFAGCGVERRGIHADARITRRVPRPLALESDIDLFVNANCAGHGYTFITVAFLLGVERGGQSDFPRDCAIGGCLNEQVRRKPGLASVVLAFRSQPETAVAALGDALQIGSPPVPRVPRPTGCSGSLMSTKPILPEGLSV